MKKLAPLKTVLSGCMIMLASAFLSCGSNETTAVDSDSTVYNAEVEDVAHVESVINGTYADTSVTGMATFDAENGMVKMVLDVTIPARANKSVAVHLHEHGDCGDDGKNAHGHWNPTNQPHGKWGVDSFHLGDIGNIKLDGEGKGHMEMETDLWSISGASNGINGKAIIIHGGEDDFKTQPTGNAGNRIGCGIIKTKM
jgi:superoxide dismutase, Cu-Zn family